MKKITLLVACFGITTASICSAQEVDLLQLLDSTNASKTGKEFSIATFKTTRLINQQTLETLGKRTLDFRISHRFGDINGGTYNAFGLDGSANIRIGLDYSYDGRFMFGIGRSSFEKLADGFLKYRLLRQTTNNSMPVSMTLFSSINYTLLKDPTQNTTGFDKYENRSSRLSYAAQVIIGRKFNSKFSLQLAPTFIHYNLVQQIRDKNDMYSIAFASRYKLTKRFAITGEYVLRLNKYSNEFSNYHNSLGFGFDLETGGHVFQIHITNSFGINEVQYIPYTTTSWKNLGVRLGFNISRVFNL